MTNNMQEYLITVTEDTINIRADSFIAKQIDNFSRNQAQRLIEEGNILVNNKILSDKNYKTKINDSFLINIPHPVEAEPIAQDIPLDILYEDKDIIVVNKPADMTVHPAAGAYSNTLVNALLFHCKGSLSGIGGVARPGIVHRIDRNTSGILVVAKNDIAHRNLAKQFEDHTIERTYFAFIYGIPNPVKGTIEGNIARSSFDRKKMAVVKTGGKHAITHYEVINQFKNSVSIIKCNLETGRTHQIRVHLSNLGYNLIGDNVYSKSKKSSVSLPTELKNFVNNFPRQALHAYSLGFNHPINKKPLNFSADFPEDLQILLNKLKNA